MNKIKHYFIRIAKNKLANSLALVYFLVSLIEISAEFYMDKQFIYITKPIVIPILIMFYCRVSKEPNFIFILALGFTAISNILLIFNYKIIGSLFLLFSLLIIIYLVTKLIRFPGTFKIVTGMLPFLLGYMYFINLTQQTIGKDIYFFVVHSFFIIFLAGFALGNYFFKPNIVSSLLLITALFFTGSQLIIALKYYFISLNIFHAIEMLLFIIGQFILVKFILLAERKKKRYEIVNRIN